MRAVRGAITVSENSKENILSAAKELFLAIVKANLLHEEEIISVIFSVTSDLNKAFPAKGIRELGYKYIPLLDVSHMDVEGALPKTIRILVYINRDIPLEKVNHIYLKGASSLRPDLGGRKIE